MKTNMRPQDKWNQEHGYISKSYKLYKNVADSFATACNTEQNTQSQVLTHFMNNYSIAVGRRTTTMNIRKKYEATNDNEYLLQSKIDSMIKNISQDDITGAVSELMSEIEKLGFGRKYLDVIEYNHSFSCHMELTDFFQSPAFDEVINYLRNRYLKEIALFYLMIDKRLMPISIRQNLKTELNFNHNHGNTLFDLYVDAIPYDVFLII